MDPKVRSEDDPEKLKKAKERVINSGTGSIFDTLVIPPTKQPSAVSETDSTPTSDSPISPPITETPSTNKPLKKHDHVRFID